MKIKLQIETNVFPMCRISDVDKINKEHLRLKASSLAEEPWLWGFLSHF
jgi:hypothetical protein